MNNVTSINKAPRLTESEVHQAAISIEEAGNKVSSLSVLKLLGRGSLTTITKHMATMDSTIEESENANLPKINEIPVGLSKIAEQLIIKVWAESQAIANKELETQSEALRQAEAKANERIAEAEEFSEEQSKRIEELENIYNEDIAELKAIITYAENELKTSTINLNSITTKHAVIANDNKNLNQSIKDIGNDQQAKNKAHGEAIRRNEAKYEVETIALRNKIDAMEKDALINVKAKKNYDSDANRLDIQIHKLQMQLDKACKDIDEAKEIHAEDVKECNMLREKASMIEGQLIAWKEIKPALPKKRSRKTATSAANSE